MSDRTMLELAAKAVGMQWSTSSLITHNGLWITYPSVKTYWNPLTDDGDALRLAVELNMGISIPVMRTPMADVVTFRDSTINVREKGNDILAATRRAITRAAAEVQLAKEGGK